MAEDGDLLWNAVSEALAPILEQEQQLEPNKLEKRVREYFKKGAKSLSFRSKPWDELVNEYADNIFSSLFCGLGDRPWLCDADFLLAVDAGVKEFFPAELFDRVPQSKFENVVLIASDRAFDEQRYNQLRWEVLQQEVKGKATQKKVGNAMDAARVEACQLGLQDPMSFTEAWVGITVEALCKTTQNEPQHILPQDLCQSLFEAMIEAGALPMTLTKDGLPEDVWETLAVSVAEAYAPIIGAAEAAQFERNFQKHGDALVGGGGARRSIQRSSPY